MVSGRTFRVCLWLHRWTGLVATPFFLLLCLTGAILIFREDIDDLLGFVPPTASAAEAAPKPLSALGDAAAAMKPGMRPTAIFIDRDTPDRAYVRVGPPGYAELRDQPVMLMNRFTAQPMTQSEPQSPITKFVFDLHANWFMGMFGELFGGAIAILVFVCLITGLVVYAPFVRKLLFGMVRRRRGTRLVQLDLHNLIGVVMLGWATVVTVTGICLAAGTPLILYWRMTELQADGPAATAPPVVSPVSVDVAAAAAQAAEPGRRLGFIVYPNTAFSGPRVYNLYLYGTHHYDERMFRVVRVDAETGQVASNRSLPWYLKVLVYCGPLHFGDYAGLPLQLFWVFCAAGTLFITGNGAYLWWLRHRRPRRTVPV